MVKNFNKIKKRFRELNNKGKFTLIYLCSAFLLSIIISGIISNLNNWGFIVAFVLFAMFFMAFNLILLLIQNDQKGYEFYLKLFLNIVTILILFGQFSVSLGQQNIMAFQTEILDRTSQSNQADLLLVSSQGYPQYTLSELWDEGQLAIGIINTGKAIAPFILVEVESDLFNGYKKPEFEKDYPLWDIKELPSSGYNSTFFKIWINPNKIENFDLGVKNIVFKITCHYCVEPITYQSIPICVYNQSIVKDCGEEWAK